MKIILKIRFKSRLRRIKVDKTYFLTDLLRHTVTTTNIFGKDQHTLEKQPNTYKNGL